MDRLFGLVIPLFIGLFVLLTGLASYATTRDVIIHLTGSWNEAYGNVITVDEFPGEVWIYYGFEVDGKAYNGYHNRSGHYGRPQPDPKRVQPEPKNWPKDIGEGWPDEQPQTQHEDKHYAVGDPVLVHYDARRPQRNHAEERPIQHLAGLLIGMVMSVAFFLILSFVFLVSLLGVFPSLATKVPNLILVAARTAGIH